jgi:hypothetical protein
MMKYLHLDCEMGGRELKYSLLTAYFMVTDDKFKVLGDLYLEVKPDDGDYVVSGQGMGVNKINLQEHDKVAIPYKEAKPLLYNFLRKHSAGIVNGAASPNWMPIRLTPVGHGVKGDISHVILRLISEGSWEQFCTYHYIDTSVVLQYLRAIGKMPMDTEGSVTALAKYFDIEVGGEDHDCRVDTFKTLGVFREFVRLGKGGDDSPLPDDFRSKGVSGTVKI